MAGQNKFERSEMLSGLSRKSKKFYEEFQSIQVQCNKALEEGNEKKARNLLKRISRLGSKFIKDSSGKQRATTRSVMIMHEVRKYRNLVQQKLSEM